MIKITLHVLLLGILFTGCNSNTPDVKNTKKTAPIMKLYANLNTYVNNQEPLLGRVEYTHVPAFNWRDIYENLQGTSANEITYKVSGKIDVPSVIKTDKIYVTFGKNVVFSKTASMPLTDAQNIMDSKPTQHSKFNLFTFVNGKKLTVDTILTDVKTDTNQKRYVDFEIVFEIKFLKDSAHIVHARERSYEIVNNNLKKDLDKIVIQIAPNTRDYESKFGIPAIY